MDQRHTGPDADPTKGFLREMTILVAIAVAIAMASVYMRTTQLIQDGALAQARSITDLLVATRSWNAVHGGVWVEKGPGAGTNPYLKMLGVPADATTTDGRVLTLRNPAIMTSEISALLLRTDGVYFHLTSLKPLNPANAPNAWESESLTRFMEGSTERWRSSTTTAGPAFDYMRPLLTEASCLPCHARQGYRVGDVRGAVSITIPLAQESRQAAMNALALGLLGVLVTTVLFAVTLTMVRRLRSQLSLAQVALVEAATVDQLTHTATRRHTLDHLRAEIERTRRSGEPLAIVMADIDHFKDVNDTLGHATGDVVLMAVAGRMITALRPYDLLGRIGGEEFLIVAPAADVSGAVAIAERARTHISGSPIGTGAHEIAVTASFGVTLVDPDEPAALDHALARADTALYESKNAGRDRVSVHLPGKHA